MSPAVTSKMVEVQTFDYLESPENVVQIINDDKSPAIIENLFSIDVSPLEAILKSGQEHNNGSYLFWPQEKIDEVLSLNGGQNSEHEYHRSVVCAERGRIWRQYAGDSTRMHFDQGPIQVLNTQVQGRKKWMLSPPSAPVKMKAIGKGRTHRHVRSIEVASLASDDVFVCMTNQGQTLVVPSGWYHHVWTIDDSLNVDWFHHKPVSTQASFRQVLGHCLPSPHAPHKRLGKLLDAGVIDRSMYCKQLAIQSFYHVLHRIKGS